MRRVGLATLLIALLSAPPLQAFIPEADRTMQAIAGVNRSSGRSQAIQLELTMRIGDRDPVARGQLISHPSGLARLELRGFNGRVDRYLLSGSELLGAKDGYRIERPQPLLQPLFFLQPSSETTLRAALQTFDVLADSIGLATCGDLDCFVIGDPRLAAPLPEPPPPERVDAIGEGSVLFDPLERSEGLYSLALGTDDAPADDGTLSLQGDLEGPELLIPDDAILPRLWVDTEDLQVRRIDRADGVFTIFGPIVSFEKLMVPAWFEIHEPGAEPIRFEVDRAVKVNAPPQVFSRKWVMTPVEPETAPDGDPAARAGEAGEVGGTPGRESATGDRPGSAPAASPGPGLR